VIPQRLNRERVLNVYGDVEEGPMRSTSWMLLLVILLGGSGALSERAPQEVASISGKHLRAIVSALPELERRHLSLEGYEDITIFESSELLIVSFLSRAPRPGQRGDPPGGQRGLEVEIDKRTNQAGGAHYVR
jgi:hypothetical protein